MKPKPIDPATQIVYNTYSFMYPRKNTPVCLSCITKKRGLAAAGFNKNFYLIGESKRKCIYSGESTHDTGKDF